MFFFEKRTKKLLHRGLGAAFAPGKANGHGRLGQ
jgi:hypothetical protein